MTHRQDSFQIFIFVTLLGLIYVGLAYIWFFGRTVWVYLYEDRLEIRQPLSKLLKDRFGFSPSRPKIIYFREIEAMRKTVEGTALLIIKDGPIWKQRKFPIPHLDFGRETMENYKDLEDELLRRVPPTCDLYSLNWLGGRTPFKRAKDAETPD